jgi:hypothetical protein
MTQHIINTIQPFLIHTQINTNNPLGISIYIQHDNVYIKVINIYKMKKQYTVIINGIEEFKFNNSFAILNMMNIILLQYNKDHTISFNLIASTSNDVLYQNIEKLYTLNEDYNIYRYNQILKSLITIICCNI